MDESEQHVAAYLRHCGHTDIVFEPDGKVPPDFMIDGRIAIEVRRLNQNYDDGMKVQGLEQLSIPLSMSIRKLLASFGPSRSGQSWYVFYRFSRPLDWTSLRRKVQEALEAFMADVGLHQSKPVERDVVQDTFSLHLYRAGTAHHNFFVDGGYSDAQSGGWLIDELRANLEHCITEKARKIEKVGGWAKYPEWWLVLVDHISFGLGDLDRELFRKQVAIAHKFSRILILNRRDPTCAFEVCGQSAMSAS